MWTSSCVCVLLVLVYLCKFCNCMSTHIVCCNCTIFNWQWLNTCNKCKQFWQENKSDKYIVCGWVVVLVLVYLHLRTCWWTQCIISNWQWHKLLLSCIQSRSQTCICICTCICMCLCNRICICTHVVWCTVQSLIDSDANSCSVAFSLKVRSRTFNEPS